MLKPRHPRTDSMRRTRLRTAAVALVACLMQPAFVLCQNDAAKDSPEAEKVYHVGGHVKPPRAIETPGPTLTEEEKKKADKSQHTGVAVLEMIVTTDGKPHNIKVVKSFGKDLDKRAVEAVKTWRFDPATKDGKPVMAKISVEVTFHLDQ